MLGIYSSYRCREGLGRGFWATEVPLNNISSDALAHMRGEATVRDFRPSRTTLQKNAIATRNQMQTRRIEPATQPQKGKNDKLKYKRQLLKTLKPSCFK